MFLGQDVLLAPVSIHYDRPVEGRPESGRDCLIYSRIWPCLSYMFQNLAVTVLYVARAGRAAGAGVDPVRPPRGGQRARGVAPRAPPLRPVLPHRVRYKTVRVRYKTVRVRYKTVRVRSSTTSPWRGMGAVCRTSSTASSLGATRRQSCPA